MSKLSPTWLLVLPLCIGLATRGAAQRTWIVDMNNGPGTNFTAIQPAVDAASPGDTILVRPSTNLYAGATIPKGLSLLGEGQAKVGIGTRLIITGIPAGQRVAVKNFKMLDDGTGLGCLLLGGSNSIVCTNCVGTVHFERVASAGSRHGPGLDINASAHVSALDSSFGAGVTVVMCYGSLRPAGGDYGIRCRQSSLLLTRCTSGGATATFAAYSYVYALPGITVDASRLVTVDSTMTGADGVCGGWVWPLAFPTSGLYASSGCTIFTKGTTFTGGTVGLPCSFYPTSGIEADPATVITADPGVAFTLSGGQLIQQNLSDVQSAGVGPGSVLSVTLRTAAVSAPYVTFFSFPAPPILFSTPPVLAPIGVWLEPATAIPMFVGVANGTQTDSVVVPPFIPLGLPAGFQTVSLVGNVLDVSMPAVAALY